jgi:hypothetical protein
MDAICPVLSKGIALVFAAKLCFFCDSDLPDFVSALSNGLTGREDKARRVHGCSLHAGLKTRC